MLCPSCGKKAYKKDKKCVYCGSGLTKVKPQEDIFCSRCKFPITANDKFCPNCGAFLFPPDKKIRCLKCGAEIKGNYCSKCGAPLLITEKQIKEKNPIIRAVKAICKLIDSILSSIVGAIRDLI